MTFEAGALVTTFSGTSNAQTINLSGFTFAQTNLNAAFTKVATAVVNFLLGLGAQA